MRDIRTQIETIATALGGKPNRKGGSRCFCPAHDDRHHPNLDIDPGDGGKLLVNCTAGCSQAEVIEALRARGLWLSGKPLGEAEKQRAVERITKRKEAKRQAQEAAAKKAVELYSAATEAPESHAYILAKGGLDFGPHVRRGAWKQRGWPDALIIPLYDAQGQITSLQAIGPDGAKDFLLAAKKRGSFYPFGRFKDHTGPVWIAEGLATAAAIHAVSGAPCVTAIDVGNLPVVAEIVRALAPGAQICIFADDDRKEGREDNPGVQGAIKAAQLVRGMVAQHGMGKKADAWDLWREQGPDALIAAMQSARPVEELERMADEQPETTTQDNGHDADLDDAAQEDAEQAAFDREVERLANLPVHAYERQRKEAAKSLGIRAGILDSLVQNLRKGVDLGSDLPFDTVTPWPEPIDPAQVLDDIAATTRRFIVCTPEVANTVALWAAMTWFMDAVLVAPLALITATEKRCGKTQLLTILSRLTARAVAVSSISPAALYRAIQAWSPALMIDEADAFMKDNEELRGIINSGHTRDTAFVVRSTGDDHTPTRFSTWGAKAIAGIGRLADTLMDRSIILELRRKLPTERVERLRYAEPSLFPNLRSMLARFAEDCQEAVRIARPDLPESLNDRQQDNWEPLLAIAQVAGGDWPSKALKAALKLSGTESMAQTIGTELLTDIRTIFENRNIDRIKTADLIDALCDDDEAPWCTYNRGKAISSRQIAKRLKDYGISSTTIRISGTTAKGYLLADFTEAFSRYIPATPLLSVTTSQYRNNSMLDEKTSVTQGFAVTDKNEPNQLNLHECYLVTDKNPLLDEESEKQGNLADEFKDAGGGMVSFLA
ncbi:MAG: DUF3631 domain-containing protein [Desulfobulbaceae bacterium]|nr:DUF3631 domain-containing protein [Desulfobulbaceae bacterium]